MCMYVSFLSMYSNVCTNVCVCVSEPGGIYIETGVTGCADNNLGMYMKRSAAFRTGLSCVFPFFAGFWLIFSLVPFTVTVIFLNCDFYRFFSD